MVKGRHLVDRPQERIDIFSAVFPSQLQRDSKCRTCFSFFSLESAKIHLFIYFCVQQLNLDIVFIF